MSFDTMKIFPGRRRAALAVVATAALAGLGAGLAYSQTQSGRAQGPPGLLAKGKFRSLTWGTYGTASMVRDASGNLRLRFSSNFMTQEAPETYVYLVKFNGREKTYWKEVAALRSNEGRQQYSLSSDAAKIPGLQVAIYCGKCNKISGVAPLAPVHTAS